MKVVKEGVFYVAAVLLALWAVLVSPLIIINILDDHSSTLQGVRQQIHAEALNIGPALEKGQQLLIKYEMDRIAWDEAVCAAVHCVPPTS